MTDPAVPPEALTPVEIAGTPGRPALALRSAVFRQGREEGWRRLDALVDRIETKGLGALSAEEIQALPRLYRAALSSLSVARTISLDRNLLVYLENLGLRAYLVVYGPRSGLWENLRRFFSQTFPQSVRNLARPLAAAALALLAGILAGYALVQSDPTYFYQLVPEELADGRGPDSTTPELAEVLFGPWTGFIDTFLVFANALFQHNTIVGLLAFGLGLALGVPTIFLLIHNGLILGAFIALHVERGLGLDFIGWLSVHGVTELGAVILCGGAGLAIAERILFPGPLPRLESLARYGREAAGVAAGAVALFFIAGFLEGGFRQLINHTPGRLALALCTLAFWLWYFLQVGRQREVSHGGG